MTVPDERRAPRPVPGWLRFVLSVSAVFAVLLASRVAVPGSGDVGWSVTQMPRLFALGIQPALLGLFLVEVVAALFLRQRRHEPALRQKLSRFGAAVSLLIAGVQGSVLTRQLGELWWVDEPLLFWGTLVGAFAFLLFAARFITRQGWFNGFAVLWVIDSSLVWQGGARGTSVDLPWSIMVGLELGAVLVTVFVVIAIRTRGRVASDAPIATPLCGLWPLLVGLELATLPGPIELQGVGSLALERGWLVVLFVVILVSAALSLALSPQRQFIPFVHRSESAWFTRAFRSAFAFSVLALVALAGCDIALTHFELGGMVLRTALLTALVVDAIDIASMKSELGPRVVVLEERRPGVALARAVELRRLGFEVHAHGATLAGLLRFFGPYAPVTLLVPASQATAAIDALRARPSNEVEERPPGSRPTLSPLSMPRRVVLLSLTLLGVLLAATPSALLRAEQGPSVRFSVFAVDDATPLPVDETSLPDGIELRKEMVSLGPDKTEISTYAYVPVDPTLSTEALFDKARKWGQGLPLPQGRWLGWERSFDADPTLGFAQGADPDGPPVETFAGLKSYVLQGEAQLTERDIEATSARTEQSFGGAYVEIRLNNDARKRFAEFTEQQVKRRIAIVIDDEVMVVPVVQTRIDGGALSLTLPFDEHVMDRAKQLAAGLRPRR